MSDDQVNAPDTVRPAPVTDLVNVIVARMDLNLVT